MAKKKLFKKNNNGQFLLVILIGLLLFALIIPSIGYNADSPKLWIDIVKFFTNVMEHFKSFWMFYTFGLALLLTYQKK